MYITQDARPFQARESAIKDVFISYGRADSKLFARQFSNRLSVAGLTVWFDFDDIPLATDFQARIDDGIEKAHNFLYIISPSSVNSGYCEKELKLALHYNKRIIPLMHVEAISYETWLQRYPNGTEAEWHTFKAEGKHCSFDNLDITVSKLNWVMFREGIDDFEQSLEGLLDLFNEQQTYIQHHTQLLTQALNWERHHRQTRYLLVGAERQAAETWLKSRLTDDVLPYPTHLHCEFITKSIKNTNNLMTQVFLCHADEDTASAEQIRQSLLRRGITVWSYRTDIQTSQNYNSAIAQGIEEADNIIFILSPHSAQSPYCQQELVQALGLNKRIIPVLAAFTEPKQIPDSLRSLQYVDLTDNLKSNDYKLDESKLLKVFNTDAAYHTEHKTWLTQALKWERQQHNPTMLLRGYNLRRAENWLKVARTHPYPPTDRHEQFIIESLRQPSSLSSDVFISYSRVDSDFARKLNEALQIQGKRTWFDQESIATGADFQQEIYRGIESSDVFLFVLSPQSINSPYCADEVEYADQLNKRIVTVLHRPIDTDDLHPVLAKFQWLDFRDQDGDFQMNFQHLLRILDTDREHLETHTRLLVRAVEWDRGNRDESLLLRGQKLNSAEQWLENSTEIEPQPTGLQQEYIRAGRARQEAQTAAEKKLQRGALIGGVAATVGILVAIASGWFAWTLNRQAELNLITALQRSAEASFALNRYELDGLSESLEAAERFQRFLGTKSESEMLVDIRTALAMGVYWIREQNRLEEHQDIIQAVAYSSDGSMFATASYDNTVKLWHSDGSLIETLKGHTEPVMSLSFSPDGQMLASGSQDGVVKLWNREANLIRTVDTHQQMVLSIQFSPDGQKIMTGGEDGTAKLWNLNGELNVSLSGHANWVKLISFSPDGKQIITGSTDGTIKLWSLDGSLQKTFDTHSDIVMLGTISPDGQTLATASFDQTVKLWNLDGQLLQTLKHPSQVWSVKFSHDGQTISSGSADGQVILWSSNGRLLDTWAAHDGQITSLDFSPDNQRLVTVGNDKLTKLWQVNRDWLTVLDGHQNSVRRARFSPDGEQIATSSDDTTVKLWSSEGKLLSTLEGHQDRVYDISFSSDGQILVSASKDGTVRLWNREGQSLIRFEEHQDEVHSVSVSPDGQLIASASSDGTAKLWRLDGTPIQTLQGHDGRVLSVSFSPDGRSVLTTGDDQTMRLWSLDGNHLQTLRGHTGRVWEAGFSPDGNMIASASSDQTIRLWDLGRDTVDVLRGNAGTVLAVSFSPDGEMIASASSDRTVKLWKKDGTLIMTLLGHRTDVNTVDFNHDGTWLATGDFDGNVLLWNVSDLSLNRLVEKGCDQISNHLKSQSNHLYKFCHEQ